MNTKLLAIFFTILFLSLITAPAILIALDDSVDVSVYFNISEEEEIEYEKNKAFEGLVFDLETELEDLNFAKNILCLEYQFKTYLKPHLNLIFPPPKNYLILFKSIVQPFRCYSNK